MRWLSLPVSSLENAVCIGLGYLTLRPRAAVDSQLENAERLKRALGIVAWRLLLRSASPTRATVQRSARNA